jgi:hypothetical protein
VDEGTGAIDFISKTTAFPGKIHVHTSHDSACGGAGVFG